MAEVTPEQWAAALIAAVVAAHPAGLPCCNVPQRVSVGEHRFTGTQCKQLGERSIQRFAERCIGLRLMNNEKIVLADNYFAESDDDVPYESAGETSDNSGLNESDSEPAATAYETIISQAAPTASAVAQAAPHAAQVSIAAPSVVVTPLALAAQVAAAAAATPLVTLNKQLSSIVAPAVIPADIVDADLEDLVLRQPDRSCSLRSNVALFDKAVLSHEIVQQWGLLGRLTDHNKRPVYMNTEDPFCLIAVGVQGAGKSHTVATVVENCVLSSSIAQQHEPIATLVMHYDQDPASYCELITLTMPNPKLAAKTGALAVGKITVLVSPSYYEQRKKYYGDYNNVTVVPLLFDWHSLDAIKLKTLMRLGSTDSNGTVPLYMNRLLEELRKYQREEKLPLFNDFMNMTQKLGFSKEQSSPLAQRLALLNGVVLQSAENEQLGPKHKSLQALFEVRWYNCFHSSMYN